MIPNNIGTETEYHSDMVLLVDIASKTFNNCTFFNVEFNNIKIDNCIFNNCTFARCDFIECLLSSDTFNNCEFNMCNLSSSVIDNDTILNKDCIIIDCIGDGYNLLTVQINSFNYYITKNGLYLDEGKFYTFEELNNIINNKYNNDLTIISNVSIDVYKQYKEILLFIYNEHFLIENKDKETFKLNIFELHNNLRDSQY